MQERDFLGGPVACLGLLAPNAGDLGSIPGQGTRSHMQKLRICIPQLKVLMKTEAPVCCNQDLEQAIK